MRAPSFPLIAPPLAAPARRPAARAPVDAERIGAVAADALRAELDTWPKPGLVSPIDNGSHDDMDYGTFLRSIAALRPFFGALAAAGAAGSGMADLRRIGVAAEAAMLAATGGVNAHRGAVFALGLLCAAAGAAAAEPAGPGAGRSADSLALMVHTRWGADILRGPIPIDSHGSGALRRFGAGGARAEAACGFPHARTVGLPALWGARGHGGDEDAARVEAFFALVAAMEDTNLLHRGGAQGLADARDAARAFLRRGGVRAHDWLAYAMEVHRHFVARRLSPGGSADLLAVTLFLDRIGRVL